MEIYIVETLIIILIVLCIVAAIQAGIQLAAYIRMEKNHKKTLEWLDALAHLTEDLHNKDN